MTRPCITCGQPVLAGPELRAIRLALGWSQGRMARELWATRSQVSRWEGGKYQPAAGVLARYEEWAEQLSIKGGRAWIISSAS